MEARGGDPGRYISEIADLEGKLAASVSKVADELAHSDCFDNEQRSEIYTILQALRNDNVTHRQAIELLAGKLFREAPSA